MDDEAARGAWRQANDSSDTAFDRAPAFAQGRHDTGETALCGVWLENSTLAEMGAVLIIQ